MTTKRTLGNIRGHIGEAKRIAKQDAAQRLAAEKAPDSIILNKNDVRGEYDAHRAIKTTLGGKLRNITADDLATFRHNMRTVQSRITAAGITAQQVIDLAASHPLLNPLNPDDDGDLGRARKEITMAVPVSSMVPVQARDSLDVRFMTNAGPDSRATRHHVIVRFHAYGNAAREMMATPTTAEKWKKAAKALTPKQAATKMRGDYLAFDCDCGRHQFFLRYLATAGGYNAGRDEHGYPKIRNPELKGVACKHVLRVMMEIVQSAAVLMFIERVMAKALASADNRVKHQTTQAEVDALAAKQAKATREIETTEARNARLQREREKRAILRAAKEPMPAPKKVGTATRLLSTQDQTYVAGLAKTFGMSADEVLRRLQGAN
ncbi:MAG: hypothetical protein WA056_01640 [Gallionella sp.]